MKQDLDARWRGDEPSHSLTWGTIMEGRSFFEAAGKIFDVGNAKRVLEIGPGYGRHLKGMQDLGMAPDFYLGVDLSEGRIARLTEQFGSPNVQFMRGDARSVDLSEYEPFDLMISSATFMHIAPHFGGALTHLRQFVTGYMAFDLPEGGKDDSVMNTAGGVLVRRYSPLEITATLQVCDLRCAGFLRFTMSTIEFPIDPARLERRDVLSFQDDKAALSHRFLIVAET